MRRPFHRDDRVQGPRVNDRIRITPIRLIDENGEMVGVVELEEGRRRAQELGLDLVEMAADVRPPVVRIMDFGKFKYEKSKQDKVSRAKTKTSELKEVRLGRSMKIDPHDVGIRLDQARRFLLEGHKVQIVQNFRGREIAHRDRGDDRMDDIIQRLSDVGRVELPPRLNGRRMTMIIGPDRAKIDAIKRREEKEKGKGGAPGEAGAAPAASKPAPSSVAGGAAAPAKAPARPPATAQPAPPASPTMADRAR
ncbi:MAG: translation initiation factor IF-3 [Phycisphaerales bacterium]